VVDDDWWDRHLVGSTFGGNDVWWDRRLVGQRLVGTTFGGIHINRHNISKSSTKMIL